MTAACLAMKCHKIHRFLSFKYIRHLWPHALSLDFSLKCVHYTFNTSPQNSRFQSKHSTRTFCRGGIYTKISNSPQDFATNYSGFHIRIQKLCVCCHDSTNSRSKYQNMLSLFHVCTVDVCHKYIQNAIIPIRTELVPRIIRHEDI